MKTYKYKLSHQSNCVRLGNLLDDMWQVHEYFHKWQRQRYKDGLPYAGYAAMCVHLTELKSITHPHWKALPSQAIQEELRRIDAAYQRFFKKLGGKPKIKKRHKFKSITLKQSGWKISDGREAGINGIHALWHEPGFQPTADVSVASRSLATSRPSAVENRLTITLRKWNAGRWRRDPVPYTFFKHRDWHGNIKRVTIKRDACNDYWLCITTNFTDTEPLPTTGESVGADFGMKDAYLTLSTGEKIHHPQPLKQSLNKLRTLNKSLSRKKKGSNGWWRCVRQLARLYRKIANQRLDFHWKLATYLCEKFDAIVLETLNLDGMKRLWGRKVSDLAFYQFVEVLKFKCIKHRCLLKQVGQWRATTKPCSDCGSHNKNLTLNDRQWTCPECGSHHDRDINAAINIKRAGVAA